MGGTLGLVYMHLHQRETNNMQYSMLDSLVAPRTAEQLVGAHPRPAQEAPRAAPLTCASSKVCAANVLAGKAEGAAQEERLLRQQAADASPAAHRPPPPTSLCSGRPPEERRTLGAPACIRSGVRGSLLR